MARVTLEKVLLGYKRPRAILFLMQRKLAVLIICFSHVFGSVSWAEVKPFYSSNIATAAFVDFINESKTVDGMLKRLEAFWTIEETQGVRQILKKHKLSGTARLPTCKANKNIATCDGHDFVFSDNKTVVFEGRNLSYQKGKAFDAFLEEIFDRSSKKTSQWRLIPEAQAVHPMGALIVLGSVAAVTAAVVIGSIYFTNELWENSKDGLVTCDGRFFVQRNKTRNLLLFATSKTSVQDFDKISQLLGEKVESCSPALAARVMIAMNPPTNTASPKPVDKYMSPEELGNTNR